MDPAAKQALDTWVTFGGLIVSTLIAVLRIPLILWQEFDGEEGAVRDPLAAAVPMATTWNAFKHDNWSGFQALLSAVRFQRFLKRFCLFVDSKLGAGVFFLIVGATIFVYVVLRVQNSEPSVQGVVVVLYSAVMAAWVVLIEWGKALKREAARRRVT